MVEYHLLKESSPMSSECPGNKDKKRAVPKDLLSDFSGAPSSTPRISPVLNEDSSSSVLKNSPRTASENSAYDNDKSASSKSISNQNLTVLIDSNSRTRQISQQKRRSSLKLKYFFMAVHFVSLIFVIGMAISMKTGTS